MAKDENAEWLFGGESGDGGQWEAHRRFISPEFNRIYRQGVVGPHHLREADFANFLVVARTDLNAASKMILEWVRTSRPQGGDYGDIAMERIAARASSFDLGTALGIVSVFAEVMDSYYTIRPRYQMFSDVWEQSENILRVFRTSIPEFSLASVAGALAREGAALSWMTGVVARADLWAQGLAGDRSREAAFHQMSERELKDFMSILVGRMLKMRADDILKLPRLGRLLFTIKDSPWHGAESSVIIRRLAGPRVSDENYLRLLESMAGVVISSDRGLYYTLSRDDLSALLGPQFKRRWDLILKKDLSPELSERRKTISRMIADARS